MTSLVRLLLVVSTAAAATELSNEEYQKKMETIAINAHALFNNYARSRNEWDLRDLDAYASTNGNITFCSSISTCRERNGEMVSGQMKVLSCGHWEEHVIPFFIRKNDVIEITRSVEYVNPAKGIFGERWLLVQNNTRKRLACTIGYDFTKSGNPTITEMQLYGGPCSIDATEITGSKPSMAENLDDVEYYLQQYVNNINRDKVKAMNGLKSFLGLFTVYPDGVRRYNTEMFCFNRTTGRRYTERRVQTESTPIEDIFLPAYLLSHNISGITRYSSSQSNRYSWEKVNDDIFVIKKEWSLTFPSVTLDCTPTCEFNTTIPDKPSLTKLSLDCDYCPAVFKWGVGK